jgi:hypothetical protein
LFSENIAEIVVKNRIAAILRDRFANTLDRQI